MRRLSERSSVSQMFCKKSLWSSIAEFVSRQRQGDHGHLQGHRDTGIKE